MEIFLSYRLLLAHFLADFPFQTKKIFEWKIKNNYGILIHSGIFAATAAILCYPYLISMRMWLAVIFCWLTHFLIDKSKVNFFFRYQSDNLFIFGLDQCLHILVIWAISYLDIFGLSSVRVSGHLLSWEVLNKTYQSNEFILGLSIFIVATYGGNILIPYLKKIFFQEIGETITVSYIYYNMAERAGITFLSSFLPSYFLLVIPFLFILRKFLKKGNHKRDFLVNVLVSLTLGIILKISLI
ncbi:DUF3307 domain-containing protein [bacterium]|nr:DUF3307 domain-containing protein [bacterium]